MNNSIDNLVRASSVPLLLNGGTFVELKGTLEILSNSFPKSGRETLRLRLKEAPGYVFQAIVPVYAVDTIDRLYGAIGAEVVLRSKKNSSKEGGNGTTILALSCANVNGYKMPFYNMKLLN